MSLINEVLRKLDEDHRPRRQGAMPVIFQAAARERRRPWLWLGGVGVAIAVAAATWAFWQEPSAPSSPQVAVKPDGPKTGDATPQASSDAESAKPAAPAKAEPEPTPDEAAGRAEPEKTAEGQGDDSAQQPEASAPAKEEKASATAKTPEPAEAAESSAASGNQDAEDTATAPKAAQQTAQEASGEVDSEPAPERDRPPLKRSPQVPVKIQVGPPSQAEPKEDAAQPNGAGSGGPGQVEVSVPREWQSRQRAQRLARQGFQALRSGRHAEASQQLAKAHDLAPDRPDVINNLGLARWRAGERSRALETFLQGVNAHPADVRLARNLSHLLRGSEGKGYREQGVKALSRALRQQDRLALYTALGELLHRMERYGEAVSVYRRGTARKGPHWRLLMGLGQALEEAGQPGKALSVYRQAEERLPAGERGAAERLAGRVQALEKALD